MRFFGLICCVGGILLAAGSCRAADSYANRSDFLSHVGADSQTFDFESHVPSGSFTSLGPDIDVHSDSSKGGSFSQGCVAEWVDGYYSTGLRGADSATQVVRFSFRDAPKAFGLDILDLGLLVTNGSPTERAIIQVRYSDNSSELFTLVATTDNLIPFFGVISASGLQSIDIYATHDIGALNPATTEVGGNIWLDNITLAQSVPEPSAMGAFIGIGGLLLTRRRRKI